MTLNPLETHHSPTGVPQQLESIGRVMIRYALVLILLWIGCLKFTQYEAANIKPLVSNSLLMSWGYKVMSEGAFSKFIGCIEIVVGLLIAARPWSARASAVGSVLAIGTFLTTLSFLLSTPGVWQPDYGFPALSGQPGQFLLKDVLLLSAAVWTAGEAMSNSMMQTGTGRRMDRLESPNPAV